MSQAQVRQLADREVQRVRHLIVIAGAGRGGAEPRFVGVLLDPGREHVLPRARVSAIAQEALLIAVVQRRHAAQRQQ